ncbi:MFS transporter [Arthrobacter gandavensis]|uniref:MFS transporter n=1 Tax=Arthrobacter gandavensis TaxID=169960 RepID=UPI00188E0CAD|nr:MFS transporter [Arthrobacter gandavensis]MBF4995072.1 MFS transporter [Arthrobacter gandavensis]
MHLDSPAGTGRNGRRRSARMVFWAALAGVILIALNFRGPIVAPSPILDLLQSELEMSVQASGLLTALPIACFGVISFLALPLLRRGGPDQAIAFCLAGILAGTLLRSAGGTGFALAGTVLIGASIAVGNVLVPVIIRRDFPLAQVPLVTGIYTAAMNIGSMTTLILTAPLADALGWRTALAVWSALAIAAALAWLRLVGWRDFVLGGARGNSARRNAAGTVPDTASRPAPATPETPAQPPVWRRPVAWLLLVAFSGQAFSFYAVSTWLPTLLSDLLKLDPAAAGAGASLFQGPAIVGALAIPLLAGRLRTRSLLWLTVAAWAALPAGLLLAPAWWAAWVTLGGIAQGAGITVIFLILVRLGGSGRQAGQLSAMVQGGGYLVAAAGPVALGSLHDLSGGWTVPLLACCVSIAALFVAGSIAAAASDGTAETKTGKQSARQAKNA